MGASAALPSLAGLAVGLQGAQIRAPRGARVPFEQIKRHHGCSLKQVASPHRANPTHQLGPVSSELLEGSRNEILS